MYILFGSSFEEAGDQVKLSEVIGLLRKENLIPMEHSLSQWYGRDKHIDE